MLTRRRLLVGGAALASLPAGCARGLSGADGLLLNDVHSQLNATRVHRVATPDSPEAVSEIVRQARQEGRAVSVSGGRHAMGGQQFATGAIHIDTKLLRRVLSFDAARGLVEVEAGIQWPELIAWLLAAQRNAGPGARTWGIVQKQTGADRLALGGAVAANVHGRGLRLPPFVADVEALELVDAAGERRRCSRARDAELFRLAVGGYGLFGVVTALTLRLAPRRKLERVVELVDADGLVPALERRIADGFLFGDWQYATDAASDAFLRKGVFSCYRPVDDAAAMPPTRKELSREDWNRLLYLSHTDRSRAFDAYAAYYLSTSGQRYWSDTHQLGLYVDDYHRALDARLGAPVRATEMITEIYVPRARLARFLDDVRRDFRGGGPPIVYGTVRLIEPDLETFLAWARAAWACVIFNLHTPHDGEGVAASARAFRRLIDLAIEHGGSYFLTYHRYATRAQVEACHPRLADFLRLKRRWDPEERFQSDWYRHYRAMFA